MSDRVRHDLLAAAEALGVEHIKAAPELGTEGWDESLWEEEFARLPAEVEGVGARVSLEFLPMYNVATLADALAIVRGAGDPAGGVLVDAWHAARSGLALEELAAVPDTEIAAIELTDVDPEPAGSLWDDTIDRRHLPGHGGYDFPAFVEAVRATGWTGAWGVEILSNVERLRPVREAVADAWAAAAAQFELADERSRR